MSGADEHEITFTRDVTYYVIAYRHYLLVKRFLKERSGRKTITDADVNFNCEMTAAITRDATVVVIFSALALEAFINDYGLKHFPGSYFNSHLDKLPPLSKWLLLPRLVVGKQLDMGSKAFESLKRLFTLRNQLVHYKTKKKNCATLKTKIGVRTKRMLRTHLMRSTAQLPRLMTLILLLMSLG